GGVLHHAALRRLARRARAVGRDRRRRPRRGHHRGLGRPSSEATRPGFPGRTRLARLILAGAFFGISWFVALFGTRFCHCWFVGWGYGPGTVVDRSARNRTVAVRAATPPGRRRDGGVGRRSGSSSGSPWRTGAGTRPSGCPPSWMSERTRPDS